MSEDGELQKIMGFSGFGGRKTAMKFDLEKMFEETRRTAREYSQQVTGVCRLTLACLTRPSYIHNLFPAYFLGCKKRVDAHFYGPQYNII